MAGTDEINSIIAADFGSVNTRVILIDLVDGAFRLVAQGVTRTTAGDPLRDVAVGLYRALEQLSEQTGRQFLIQNRRPEMIIGEQPDGSGVDALLATASVGQPLQVVVVGLMPDVSIASAQHVLAGSYVRVVDRLSLADIRTPQQQINAILAKKPDLIFVVGGTDAGAEAPILDMVRIVRDAVRVAAKKPMVLYAGNRAVQGEVNNLLTGLDVIMADNVRPSLLDEELGSAQQGLAAMFDRYKVQHGGGFDEISGLSALGVLPTAQSYTNVVRYLGETVHTDRRAADDAGVGVLALDVGSSTTTVAASIKKHPYINIRTDIGIGHSAASAYEQTTPGNIRRWLTWDADDDEIASYAYNKSLRPATIPQTERELELEYALTREAIRLVVEQARAGWRGIPRHTMPALRPLIGAGTVLANAPHSGIAALLMLDAIQPEGVAEVWLDPAGLIPALGSLAYLKPEAVVQMLDAGDLLKVGTVVCASGKVRRIGRGGLRVSIRLSDGHVERRQVPAGTMWTYPLPPGQTAEVEVRASRGLSIQGGSRAKWTLEGGASGLIFDARGRPLPLPRDAEARARLYPAWQAGTKGIVSLRADDEDETQVDHDALGKVEFSEAAETAAPVVVDDDDTAIEVADAEGAGKRRRGLFGFLGRGKSADEEVAEQQSAAMQDLLAVAAVAEEEAQVEAAASEPAPAASGRKPRGLFGRVKQSAADSGVDEDAGDEPPADEPADAGDEIDDMMAELRDATDDSKKKRRGGLFRR
jgi:uncharacterized protein (TIGR01319 family)